MGPIVGCCHPGPSEKARHIVIVAANLVFHLSLISLPIEFDPDDRRRDERAETRTGRKLSLKKVVPSSCYAAAPKESAHPPKNSSQAEAQRTEVSLPSDTLDCYLIIIIFLARI